MGSSLSLIFTQPPVRIILVDDIYQNKMSSSFLTSNPFLDTTKHYSFILTTEKQYFDNIFCTLQAIHSTNKTTQLHSLQTTRNTPSILFNHSIRVSQNSSFSKTHSKKLLVSSSSTSFKKHSLNYQ